MALTSGWADAIPTPALSDNTEAAQQTTSFVLDSMAQRYSSASVFVLKPPSQTGARAGFVRDARGNPISAAKGVMR